MPTTGSHSALAAVNEVLGLNLRVLKEPSAVVGVAVLADSSVQIVIKPWTNVADYGPAGAEINKAIVEEFRSRKISIPYPQREVRLLNPAA